MHKKYRSLNLVFSPELQDNMHFRHFHDYRIHPELTFKNFLCSFNGTVHISRYLLVAMLDKFGLFDPQYSSKNFSLTNNELNGHLSNLANNNLTYLGKFFSNNSEFLETKYTFGHTRFDHNKNIYNLESKLTDSFVNIVSETMATSYVPFITEKFLYSIVTRGLFVAYAQPRWHEYLENIWGFRPYRILFDYKFDSIADPVERLLELISMVSKYNILNADDLRDLYQLEHETIEYNYDHYFSKNYIKSALKHV